MFSERRQNFENLFNGQYIPEWFVNTWHTRHRPQPTALVIQVPQRTTEYGLETYGFGIHRNLLFIIENIQINSKSSAQKFRVFKRRQAFLERKTVCSSLPFPELFSLKHADEERNRHFQKGFDLVNTVCCKLLNDKHKLMTLARRCSEQICKIK